MQQFPFMQFKSFVAFLERWRFAEGVKIITNDENKND
jgi:hypothetical protein